MTLEPVRTAPWNTLAIVAFVLAFVVPPGAIVCGHIALGQVRASGEQGYPLALAGTIIGYALTEFIVLFLILWVSVVLSILAMFGSALTQVPRS